MGNEKTESRRLYSRRSSTASEKPASVMYSDMVDTSTSTISRSSFYRIVDILTHGELRERRSVDYVTGLLVYDTFDQLREIIAHILPDEPAALECELEVITAWLKYAHGSSSSDQSCPRHNIKFGLSDPSSRSTTNARKVVTCDACKSLHKFFFSVRNRVLSVPIDPSALQVVDDIYHKLHLYMGHRLRVLNQQNALEMLARELAQRAESGCLDSALMIIDFKMKVEPIYFKEKTSDHFGKRGMSWHGVLVRHWELVTDCDSNVRAVESKYYYDHIAETDNKQDKGSVLAMLEAAILALKRDLPHVKKVTVQSDNASSYQNAAVILWLPVIGAAHGIQIVRYVHTETQDGKSMLDAHFAQAMRKILRYVRQQHNCIAPSQIVSAITADRGLLNCLAELITYNRARLKAILTKLEPLEGEFTKLAGRANDVFYNLPVVSMPDTFSLDQIPDFTVRVFQHSDIGDGVNILVRPSNGTCCLHTGEFPEAATSSLEPMQELVDTTSNKVGSGTLDRNRTNIENSDIHIGDSAVEELASTTVSSLGVDQERPDIIIDHEEVDDVAGIDHTVDDDEVNDDEIDDNVSANYRGDSDVESESSVDGDNADEEMINKSKVYGCVTLVGIETEAQLRRRERKWKRFGEREVNHLQTAVHTEHNLEAHAKRELLAMQKSGTLRVVDVAGLPHEISAVIPVTDADDQFPEFPLPELSPGWARRPSRGSMYGAKYIKHYEDDIIELFGRGAAESAQKLGAGRMLEALKKKHKGKFNLPAETEIRSTISKLFASSKRKASSTHHGAPSKRVKTSFQNDHEQFLVEMVAADPEIKPKDGLKRFYDTFLLAVDVVEDGKVRSKISALKQKHKRQHHQEGQEGRVEQPRIEQDQDSHHEEECTQVYVL